MSDLKDQNLLWDSYNNLLLGNDVDRIRKLAVRYDLFKISMEVPGSIVECGVFKGAGWMYWLKLLKVFSPGERKSVIGFDTFSSFASDHLLDYEKESASEFVDEADFEGIDYKLLLKNARNFGFNNGELIAGEVSDTIPKFARENQGMRISLLNLDFDTYEGTKVALDHLYDLVSPGGIIVLDEYGKEGWGESDAVDEFILGKNLKIEAIKYSSQPTALIRKPS
jgi:hypothetical protein